jgi:lipopolysaccharide/colanic/teichoic acid biosynthesis glycosyltransferase
MKSQKIQYWVLATDLAWILMAMTGAYAVRDGVVGHGAPQASFAPLLLPCLVALGLWCSLFFGMKLDGFTRGWELPAILSQLMVAVVFLTLSLLATGYLFRLFVSRLIILLWGAFLFGGFTAIRHGARLALSSKYLTSCVRRVLIVGDGPIARELGDKIEQHPEMMRRVIGFLCSSDVSSDARSLAGSDGGPIVVHTLGVMDLLRRERVDEIIIALDKAAQSEIISLTAQCQREAISVSIIPYAYELYLSRPYLLDIGGLPIVQLHEVQETLLYAIWKRATDLVLGSCFVLFTLPALLFGAIILRNKNGGVFCREPRCGRKGRTFLMWRLNSDRVAQNLPLGEALLQQFSITELPQLWNVLRGDMSLVGPRPESPERVKHYSDWQRQRLNGKPGITGLAQVHGLRHQHSSEEKTRFDLQYMLNSSPSFDASLLLQTAWTLAGRLVRIRKVLPLDRQESQRRMFERNLADAHSTQSSAD